MNSRLLTLIVSSLLAFFAQVSCSSNAPKSGASNGGKTNGTQNQATPRPASTQTSPYPTQTNCTNLTQAAGDESGDAVDGNTHLTEDGVEEFNLFTQISYTGDIKAILDSKCTSCHNQSKGLALDSYSAAKNSAAKMIERVNATGSKKMPPSGDLTTDEKAKLTAWIGGGLLESTSSSTPSITPTISSSTDCPEITSVPVPSTEPFVDLWAQLENPPKLKECHDQGKVYDRRGAGSCHTATYPATFDCSEAAIITALGGSQQAKDALDKNKTDGFLIDQCGSNGTKAVIFFMKKRTEADSLFLDIRLISN